MWLYWVSVIRGKGTGDEAWLIVEFTGERKSRVGPIPQFTIVFDSGDSWKGWRGIGLSLADETS